MGSFPVNKGNAKRYIESRTQKVKNAVTPSLRNQVTALIKEKQLTISTIADSHYTTFLAAFPDCSTVDGVRAEIEVTNE